MASCFFEYTPHVALLVGMAKSAKLKAKQLKVQIQDKIHELLGAYLTVKQLCSVRAEPSCSHYHEGSECPDAV